MSSASAPLRDWQTAPSQLGLSRNPEASSTWQRNGHFNAVFVLPQAANKLKAMLNRDLTEAQKTKVLDGNTRNESALREVLARVTEELLQGQWATSGDAQEYLDAAKRTWVNAETLIIYAVRGLIWNWRNNMKRQRVKAAAKTRAAAAEQSHGEAEQDPKSSISLAEDPDAADAAIHAPIPTVPLDLHRLEDAALSRAEVASTGISAEVAAAEQSHGEDEEDLESLDSTIDDPDAGNASIAATFLNLSQLVAYAGQARIGLSGTGLDINVHIPLRDLARDDQGNIVMYTDSAVGTRSGGGSRNQHGLREEDHFVYTDGSETRDDDVPRGQYGLTEEDYQFFFPHSSEVWQASGAQESPNDVDAEHDEDEEISHGI